MRLWQGNIDPVVLDIMLPKITGFSVLHEIRKKSVVPVLMLTAIENEYTQVTSFDEQADDYITKPFSMVLPGRRVTALLRRSGKGILSEIVTFGDVTVDFSGYTAQDPDEKIDITPKETHLLRLLIEHKVLVLTRSQIPDDLWVINAPIIDRTIDTCIKNLRKKLRLNRIVTVKVPKLFLHTGVNGICCCNRSYSYLSACPQRAMEITMTDTAANITELMTVGTGEEKIVIQAIESALPFSLICSLVISVICSFLFSKAIVAPIEHISSSTERMMKSDWAANCPIHPENKIGVLAQNVNNLYSNLLSAIEHLEQEKDRVSEMERAKVDFLRAASHELKTPVTALNATLENMILGV